MKTFDEIYEELQSTNNNELNEAWKEAKKESEKSNKIVLTICLIIDFLIILFAIKKLLNVMGYFMFIPTLMVGLVSNLFVFIIVKLIFGKHLVKYNMLYKNIVINKLMNNFYNNLEYFPEKEMPEYIYKEVEYIETYDRYESEDYMEAQIDNKYSIQMAEVLTEEERTTEDSEGNKKTEWITKFHGLFSKILMHKSIKGELRIVRNGIMRFNKERVEMDSSEFERYFDVQASDKILGMRLLTADIMEELIEFQNKTNMQYDVYIKDNELYLRFHSGSMFEVGRLKEGAIGQEMLRKYFYMLNFTYNLSKKFINLVNEIEI